MPNKVGDYSGDPKQVWPKQPHEVLNDIAQSNPADPSSGPIDVEGG